jgi:Cu(I)/Ag(I) efflux system protein CusF
MRRKIISLVMTIALASPALASDDHSGHAEHSGHEAMQDGVQTQATINSIADNMINLTHGPIPEIGWPAMTMDLPLLEGAKVDAIAEGEDAMILLEKGEDGMYAIRAVMPVE